MVDRPTSWWRDAVLEERQEIAAGFLPPDDTFAEELWPPAFTEAVDAALVAYENEVARLRNPSDDDLFAVAERVVLALNEIDAEHGSIQPEERDELCRYIEVVLARAGVDVEALCARRGEIPEVLTARRNW